MKKILLLLCFAVSQIGFSQNTNLVSNGNVELWAFPNGSPDDWSTASDFGFINQNTTDFIEGTSSAQLTSEFGSEIAMFTTVDIPLEAGITYDLKFSYKFLGSDFNTDDNIVLSIFSIGPIASVNIQDNNWNMIEAEFTPTVTNSAYELTVSVFGDSFSFNNYEVLIDDIIIEEQSTLSIAEVSPDTEIRLISLENNQLLLKKSDDLIIEDVSIFSTLGLKQNVITSNDFTELNMQNLSSGIYLINFSTSKGVITKKIALK